MWRWQQRLRAPRRPFLGIAAGKIWFSLAAAAAAALPQSRCQSRGLMEITSYPQNGTAAGYVSCQHSQMSEQLCFRKQKGGKGKGIQTLRVCWWMQSAPAPPPAMLPGTPTAAIAPPACIPLQVALRLQLSIHCVQTNSNTCYTHTQSTPRQAAACQAGQSKAYCTGHHERCRTVQPVGRTDGRSAVPTQLHDSQGPQSPPTCCHSASAGHNSRVSVTPWMHPPPPHPQLEQQTPTHPLTPNMH